MNTYINTRLQSLVIEKSALAELYAAQNVAAFESTLKKLRPVRISSRRWAWGIQLK